MVITEVQSLRAESGSCSSGDATFVVELVRYVFLYLGFEFGLEFSISSFGFSSSYGVGLSSKRGVSDPVLCGKVVALSHMPARSSFQEYGCLSAVLLCVSLILDAALSPWESVSSFFLSILLHRRPRWRRTGWRHICSTAKKTVGASPEDFNVISVVMRVPLQGTGCKTTF
ncbi:hypothetical protein BS78_K336800 [Paspalum vaginatum]|uniref:Uncharacterized protein n=1 Tax=Paspalum vaginatum TaxID=158149 RepID=A0A9W8CEF1_9POAL|nr:hypothetical protein BS78_K336800 [Paspalum vaginatum]